MSRPSTQSAAASTVVEPLLQGPDRAGRLLGASPAAIYLGFDVAGGGAVAGQPGVVALLPASSVRLPLGMVVAGALPAPAPNAAVRIGDGAVSVGDDAWVPARWFDPRPRSLTAVSPARVAAAADIVREVSAAEAGVAPGPARSAVTALLAGDAEPAYALLGAGPGLTPAGDDVIAGALATRALLGGETGGAAVTEFLHNARRATTSLSAALLACAAAGQVVPQAAEFLAALCGTGEVQGALSRLRSVGSTSGTALALGIVAALEVDCRDDR